MKGVKIGDKVVFDLESIFLRLLIVGQQRDMELMPIFGYELCAVPPLLVDEYGCLRKGNKAPLVERLGVKLQLPDVVIMDAQQCMCHVIWPWPNSHHPNRKANFRRTRSSIHRSRDSSVQVCGEIRRGVTQSPFERTLTI